MTPTSAQIFLCLGAAHVLGDFLFQTRRMARGKENWSILVGHSFLVAGLSYLLCGAWTDWTIPVAIFVAHGAIDAVKARLGRHDLRWFLADQVAHGASLVAIALVVVRLDLEIYWPDAVIPIYLKVLILVSGTVVTVVAGAVVIALAVEPLLAELHRAAATGGEVETAESRGFAKGGKIIGQLERALILLFILSNQPAGIGFLIAAKSIFRFGELREHRHRMEAEYIIIGTMASFLFGLVAALITKGLLDGL